jgi:hypothetical protein
MLPESSGKSQKNMCLSSTLMVSGSLSPFCNCFSTFFISGLVTFCLFLLCLVNLFHVAHPLTQKGVHTLYTAACPIWNGSSWDLQCGLVPHENMRHSPIMCVPCCFYFNCVCACIVCFHIHCALLCMTVSWCFSYSFVLLLYLLIHCFSYYLVTLLPIRFTLLPNSQVKWAHPLERQNYHCHLLHLPPPSYPTCDDDDTCDHSCVSPPLRSCTSSQQVLWRWPLPLPWSTACFS